MSAKKFWRCNICNDIHYGIAPPEKCPTCQASNAYCEVDKAEAQNIETDSKKPPFSKEELKNSWNKFCEKNEFSLNPDEEHTNLIAQGVMQNEQKFGLKLCPCRLRDGSRERDLELICPCNFFTHDTWKSKRECWCGLFVKMPLKRDK